MRKFIFYILLFAILLPSCSKQANGTSKAVKPKPHHWWYNYKKDKGKKRIKVVRMKN